MRFRASNGTCQWVVWPKQCIDVSIGLEHRKEKKRKRLDKKRRYLLGAIDAKDSSTSSGWSMKYEIDYLVQWELFIRIWVKEIFWLNFSKPAQELAFHTKPNIALIQKTAWAWFVPLFDRCDWYDWVLLYQFPSLKRALCQIPLLLTLMISLATFVLPLSQSSHQAHEMINW